LVDTQNTRQQTLVSNELLEALPTGSTGLISIGALTPGMTGNVTVGGSAGTYIDASQYGTTFHGKGGSGSFFIQYDGMRVANMEQNGGTGYITDTANVDQVVVETGGLSAEGQASSVVMNMIPKEGSNSLKLETGGLFTNGGLQQRNLTDELVARGLTTPGKVNKLYDVNGSVGGPLKRDRLWLFASVRKSYTNNQIPGAFYNRTQGTPFYTADSSRPAFTEDDFKSYTGRVTWQAGAKQKVTFFADVQDECQCRRLSGNAAAEALEDWHFDPQGLYQVTWTWPVTNKLLFQAGAGLMLSHWPNPRQPEVGPNDISILDTSTGLLYNAFFAPALGSGYGGPKDSDRYNQRFSVSYVTGSHAFKTGIQMDEGVRNFGVDVNGGVQYQFSGTRPIAIVEVAVPWLEKERLKTTGLFAQDQWTLKRVTLNVGLRFDYVNGSVPAQSLAAGMFVPARNLAPVSDVPNWKDLTPRLGASYDLFGNGKTAFKVSLGKYLGANGTATGLTSRNNPLQTSINTATRTWNDANGNYIPDCILANPALNGECGAINNSNFGQVNANATTFAPAVIHGFGNRDYLWDVSVELQHELLTGLSVSSGYYHNRYGNFNVTRNLQVGPADYSPYCVTAPTDARLPGGGGAPVCGLYDVAPAKFGRVTNRVSPASEFGRQTQVSDFVNLTFNARLHSGIRMGGGVDAGRTVTDNCFVIDSPQQLQYTGVSQGPVTVATGQLANCHIVTPFGGTTQLKLLGAYPLPFPGDFVLSGTYQNVPGPAILANYPAPNRVIAPSLGRNLAACGTSMTCNATITVPLIAPQTRFEARRSQLDFRVSKIVNLGSQARLQANLDIYNALNASSILTLNTTYGPQWLRPISILNGRLFQFGGQLRF
jgi:hypothetical protein